MSKLEIIKANWSWGIAFLACLINGGVTSPMVNYTWLFTSIQNDINATTVQTGLIGSVAFSVCYLASPLALIVEGFIGLHLTIILASTLTMITLFVSSYMTSFWGLLLSYGLVYGTFACFSLHSTFCVLFRYFKRSKRSNASGFVYTGISASNIILSLIYERLVVLVGWRLTLRVTAVYTLLLAVPSSFLMYPREDRVKLRHVSRQIDVNSSVTIKKGNLDLDIAGDRKISTVSEKVGMEALEKNGSVTQSQGNHQRKTWVKMFTNVNAWMIMFAVFLPGMAWTAYWTNIVSYFESLGMTEQSILLNITILIVFELLGRGALAIFIDKLPFREVNALIIMNLVFVVVTSVFALRPTEIVVSFCSAFIGIGRGCAIVLPYNATAELLKGYSVDHAVTLTMLALGVGFAVGAIPAGLVYDATNSYSSAFIINALFFLIGSTLLVLLQVQRRCTKARKRRRSLKKRSDATQPKPVQPSMNYAYEAD